jgi:hypothetical protein
MINIYIYIKHIHQVLYESILTSQNKFLFGTEGVPFRYEDCLEIRHSFAQKLEINDDYLKQTNTVDGTQGLMNIWAFESFLFCWSPHI